jgi:GTPase KRas protein
VPILPTYYYDPQPSTSPGFQALLQAVRLPHLKSTAACRPVLLPQLFINTRPYLTKSCQPLSTSSSGLKPFPIDGRAVPKGELRSGKVHVLDFAPASPRGFILSTILPDWLPPIFGILILACTPLASLSVTPRFSWHSTSHVWKDDVVQAGGVGRWRCGQDGSDDPGKTQCCPQVYLANLLPQLCLNHFVETYDPTIEDSYRKQVVIDQQACMLEVLDTAGQEEYTALRDQWIRDGEGFVLVYSITSRNSFIRIQKFYNQVQRVKESGHPNSPTGASYLPTQMNSSPPYGGPAPVMLVGNKSDKHNEREVSSQEGQALAKELGCEFVEASAKSCINVERAFFDVVRQLRRQRQSPSKNTGSKPMQGITAGMRDHHYDANKPPRLYRTENKKRTKCSIL